MATRDELPWLNNPDVDEGTQRSPDRDDIRWRELGAILTEVSSSLAEGRYVCSANLNDTIEIAITTGPPEGLTLAEVEVLEAWFDYVDAPRGDPWSDGLVNGRHRLWNVWKHAPHAVLPIRSDLLDYSEKAADDLEKADIKNLSKGIADRSPLYIAEITEQL